MEEYQLILLSILGPIIAAGAVGYFARKIGCLNRIGKRTFRQSQALILLAGELDLFKRNVHSDGPKTEFQKNVEKILRDEKGNL